MYIVEIGILYNQAPLVDVGFYRENEMLSDKMKNQIFLAIFNMFSEIFRDNLKKLIMDEYTVLFYGYTPAGRGKLEHKGEMLEDLILNYTIVDLENDKLRPDFLEIVEIKMESLREAFLKTFRKDETITMNSNVDDFRENIKDIFKDLLKTPEERFKSLWEKKKAG